MPYRRLGKKTLNSEPPAPIAADVPPAPLTGEVSPLVITGDVGDEATPSPELSTPGSHSPAHFAAVPPQRGRAGRRELLVVVALSFALAVALWHNAWANPLGSQLGGVGHADEYAWFLAWMPYALGHGLDPLISHYVNFPSGVNLMWNTSVVLPSFVMSPVTVIFGAAFSYNIAERDVCVRGIPALGGALAFARRRAHFWFFALRGLAILRPPRADPYFERSLNADSARPSACAPGEGTMA